MEHVHKERRRVQRVRLPQPLRATVDGVKAFIVDISLTGVRVMHQDELGSGPTECRLRAEWDGFPFELRCTVVRTTLHQAANATGRSLYHSGMIIVSASDTSMLTLRKLIEHHVERALDEQKANARGVPPPLAAQSMQTGAPSSFVRHELTMGRWREIMTPTNAQPEQGFTIGAHTSRAEVEMLRRAYEAATSHGERVLIRRLAALSVTAGEVVQARRYLP
ncbi:MAG TPA: PilZ domain-containing protein [Thermoanaerobaculia bacterium]|nr:PilZ domain-containing protein [Thermoanaerobaculia bacterium]